jgi:hypothetical protein
VDLVGIEPTTSSDYVDFELRISDPRLFTSRVVAYAHRTLVRTCPLGHME